MYKLKMIFTIILINFLIFVLFEEISAQVPDTLWTRTFGGSNIDIGHDVKETADGGFIITGYTRSFGTMSGRNVWLLKTDMNGNEEWNNAFGGDDDDEGYSVQQTSDGGYVVSGLTKSFGAGAMDVYLIKTDSLGNLQWTKTFGGTNDEEGYSVLQTNDGGYIIAGVTSSFSSGGRDLFLIKTDASGNLSWQKNLGGLSSDGAWEIQHTSDGGFIIVGWTFSHGPGFLGNAWLVKTDSLGNEQWNKAFGGTDVDRGYSVQQTTDGGYILTGYTDSFGAGLYNMLLIKTDNSGNQQWMKTFGGSGRDYGHSVRQTADGGYIAAGYTLSFGAGGDDFYLVKTDADGNQEWFKTFGGSSSDVAYAVQVTSDGGYIITGHTLSYGAGLHDVWLIRLETVIPVELISFIASVNKNSVSLEWITATETNNRGFEVERSQKSKVKSQSNWETISFINGSGTTTETQFYNFTDSNVKSGKYSYRLKQIDFDGTFEYSNIVEIEVFAPDIIILEQNYPNPFNPVTKIRYSIPYVIASETGQSQHVTLKVYDILGNEAAVLVNGEQEAGIYEVMFNAYSISSGTYFYQLRAGEYVQTRKMILLK
jgi:hypothetical protein